MPEKPLIAPRLSGHAVNKNFNEDERLVRAFEKMIFFDFLDFLRFSFPEGPLVAPRPPGHAVNKNFNEDERFVRAFETMIFFDFLDFLRISWIFLEMPWKF